MIYCGVILFSVFAERVLNEHLRDSLVIELKYPSAASDRKKSFNIVVHFQAQIKSHSYIGFFPLT
jgi:hypothetical protein